jgi:hypothetical protein
MAPVRGTRQEYSKDPRRDDPEVSRDSHRPCTAASNFSEVSSGHTIAGKEVSKTNLEKNEEWVSFNKSRCQNVESSLLESCLSTVSDDSLCTFNQVSVQSRQLCLAANESDANRA